MDYDTVVKARDLPAFNNRKTIPTGNFLSIPSHTAGFGRTVWHVSVLLPVWAAHPSGESRLGSIMGFAKLLTKGIGGLSRGWKYNVSQNEGLPDLITW